MNAEVIYVKGTLPFVLQLEDSIDKNGKAINGKEIPIKSNNGKTTCALFFKKCIRKDNVGLTVPTEDFFGEFTFSEFFIAFTQQYTNGTTLNELFFIKRDKRYDFDSIAEYSTKILNKFVEIYKVELQPKKDWIPYLTRERIGFWNIRVFDKKGKKLSFINRLEYRGTGEMIGTTISDTHLKKIKSKALEKEVRIKPVTRFIQLANRYFRIGDYLLSILFTQFYFEKWVFELFRWNLGKTHSKEQIDAQMIKENGKYINYIDALKKILGSKEFKNSLEFKEFDKSVTKIRDEIVHRERDTVSKEEALKGENSTKKLTAFIWNKTKST
jgi:hypothetical protein